MDRILEPEVMDTHEEVENYVLMNNQIPNEAFIQRLCELGAFGKMLDIGCGSGEICLMAAEEFPDSEFIGIDLAEKMLTLANENLSKGKKRYCCSFEIADAKDLGFPPLSFDTVFSNTILHHIPEPALLLTEAWRVLKPGGLLLIRDLIRPSQLESVQTLVEKHASGENTYSKNLFHASLCASLNVAELKEIAGIISPSLEVVVDSDRHMSLQGRKPEVL